jgi:uncharacterized Zn finger protein (UPF0148 family)
VDESTLSCPNCGGSFELVALAAEVDCPYCGHHHRLAPELLERMAAYRHSVEAKVAQMAQHGEHVAAADRFVETYASRGGFAGTFLLVAGLPLLLTGGAILAQRAMPDAEPWLPAALAVGVTAIALLTARFGFGVKASDTMPIQMGMVDVCCPECGAAAVLAAGDAVGTCGFCNGQLLATAVAVGRGADAARRAERQAAIQRFRKEREVMLHVNRPPKIASLLVPLFAVAVLGGIVYAAFAEGGTNQGLAALGGAAVATAVIATMMVRSSLSERSRLHAYRDLAHQLRGRLSYGVPELIGWLNRYWPVDYPIQHLYTDGHLVVASTGYPTMVSLKEGRAEALFGADMGDAASNPEANRHKTWLQELGFVVRLTDAGLWLEASPELRKRFGEDAATYLLFAPALAHGARMLGAMGAKHVA